ncbi:MAG: hypothetical protein BWY19_00064 [bacterium ADurb.Bin212]|nr:MAG: hypothetical protein BWY19_00064 [bacterium ADurb.Bin212]
MFKNRRILIFIIATVIIFSTITILFMRKDEDAWVKDSSGNWVMHGNPAIHDFDSCAKKYPVRETYPEQCAMPNGPTFTKEY